MNHRDHQTEEACLLGQQNPSSDKASELCSAHPSKLGQHPQALSKASRRVRSLAWLSRELKAEPRREMAATGAGGRDRLQRRDTETMPRHVRMVSGRQSSARDETHKGPSREAILPSFQHP